ncbi:MAG TPA: hypothetical protein VE935_23475 [Burkholderiales bacterium]|jgi:hypothetical protein|nr:hypothetical protein [Burkholderiales bacterium]
MTTNAFRYPTPEEVMALEREARKARAEEMARLVKAAAASIRTFFTRPTPVRVKTPRHA